MSRLVVRERRAAAQGRHPLECRVSGRGAGQAGDRSQQRVQPGRRLPDQIDEGIAATSRLDEALAQMQQMAARLHLARAAQVGRIHLQAGKRIASGDQRVIGEDGAELERETHRASDRTPAPRAAAASPGRRRATSSTCSGAGAQVVGASADRRSPASWRAARRRRRPARTRPANAGASPKMVAQVARRASAHGVRTCS